MFLPVLLSLIVLMLLAYIKRQHTRLEAYAKAESLSLSADERIVSNAELVEFRNQSFELGVRTQRVGLAYRFEGEEIMLSREVNGFRVDFHKIDSNNDRVDLLSKIERPQSRNSYDELIDEAPLPAYT